MAVCEIGIELEKFYELSIYEWVLHLEKYNRQIDKQKLDQEIQLANTFEIITSIYNVNRDPKTPALKRKDLIKLSWDKEEEIEKLEPMKSEDVEKRFKKNGSK